MSRRKMHKLAFYILIGEYELTRPQAYIGESENFKERVKNHDNKKAFWQKALVFGNHSILRLDAHYSQPYLCAVTFKNNDYGERKSKLSVGI